MFGPGRLAGRYFVDSICVQSILLYCVVAAAVICDARVSLAPARAPPSFVYCNSRKFAHVTPETLLASTSPHTRPPPPPCSAPRARRNSSRATSSRCISGPIPQKFETGNGGTPVRRKCKTIAMPQWLSVRYVLCDIYIYYIVYTQNAVFSIFAPPRAYTIDATLNINIVQLFHPWSTGLEIWWRFSDIHFPYF